MSGLHDAGRPVDGAAEKVVVASLDDSEMQPGAHAQRDMVVRGQTGQRLLQCCGSVKRVQRIAECGVHSIAGHLHYHATVCLDRLPRQPVVFRQGMPLRSGAFEEGSGRSPAMRINAISRTPANPPPTNAAKTHHNETIYCPRFLWCREIAKDLIAPWP